MTTHYLGVTADAELQLLAMSEIGAQLDPAGTAQGYVAQSEAITFDTMVTQAATDAAQHSTLSATATQLHDVMMAHDAYTVADKNNVCPAGYTRITSAQECGHNHEMQKHTLLGQYGTPYSKVAPSSNGIKNDHGFPTGCAVDTGTAWVSFKDDEAHDGTQFATVRALCKLNKN